jgi:hypothetical protein
MTMGRQKRIPPAAEIEARIRAKVAEGPIPAHAPQLGPCLVWTGYTIRGYASISINDEMVYVHRWVLEQATGPLGPGEQSLHRCDNRPCVRLAHLFRGTQRDNITDM